MFGRLATDPAPPGVAIMAKKIGLVVLLLLIALAIGVATRPPTFRVERTTTISAPPEVVFGFVNDFHKWKVWSPFEKLDTAATKTFSGADAGVGAAYAWSGNSDAGQGTMTIKESTVPQRIAIDLHFIKPFESTSLTEFTFVPSGQGTTVTWTMSGDNTLMGKVVALFASMDKLVGGQFAEGLASLKSVSEAEAQKQMQAPPVAPDTAKPSPPPPPAKR